MAGFLKLSNKALYGLMGEVVEVMWKDAASVDGWLHIDDLQEHGLVTVKNVGYLLDYDQTHIKLASGLTESAGIAGIFMIPRPNILKIKSYRGFRFAPEGVQKNA